MRPAANMKRQTLTAIQAGWVVIGTLVLMAQGVVAKSELSDSALLHRTEPAKIRPRIEERTPQQKHWAFSPPKRSALPEVRSKSWPRNAVDHFILKQLEQEGLKPAPEASRETLIRRIALDLTGLPFSEARMASLDRKSVV